MNKLLLSIIAILMIGFLGMTWLVIQQNERANNLAAEIYQRVEIPPSAEINWTPTFITIEDAQGRARARGYVFLVHTAFDINLNTSTVPFDTEIK